jgi:hypothetical protein
MPGVRYRAAESSDLIGVPDPKPVISPARNYSKADHDLLLLLGDSLQLACPASFDSRIAITIISLFEQLMSRASPTLYITNHC